MSIFTDPRWNEALGHLPDYLGNHVRVSVTALALGLAVSLPLATTAAGLPQGMMLGSGSGREDVLLGLSYELEEAAPWPLVHA